MFVITGFNKRIQLVRYELDGYHESIIKLILVWRQQYLRRDDTSYWIRYLMRRFIQLQKNPMEMMVKRRSPHLCKWVSTSCTEINRRWRQFWGMSYEIDWKHWRSRVASRGPTYVAKVTTPRVPGKWVPNDECAIDRLNVKSWINVMKQDWRGWINLTMNGRGLSVLIWGEMCRTLLGDKGKPLSGDKVTRTDEHGLKTLQGRMACVRTNVYVYTYGLNFIRVWPEFKCVLYTQ